MNLRSLGHRAPLLWVLLPLMTGLIAGKLAWLPLPLSWYLGGALVLAAGAVGWSRGCLACLIGSVFLSGVALYDHTRARLPDWEALPPREVRVTLEVTRVFPPRPEGRSVGGLARILASDTHLAELAGQTVYFSLVGPRGRPPAPPVRSSRIAVTGVLAVVPRDPPGDTFDGYLADAGINFRLTRARLVETLRPADAYHRFCERALARFNRILSLGLDGHPELGGVFRAMLLGQKQELSDEQNTLFMQSGTMHLFAISGLHIAAIAAAIYAGLAVLRLPGWARFFTGSAAVWLYVDITGATPSAVRAFLMVALLHGSRVLRLPGNALSALVTSAVLVLALDPMQFFSASFQMSYGIVAALLLLGLPLSDWLQARFALFARLPGVTWRGPHRAADGLWRGLLAALSLGIASTLVSTLWGIQFFQLFTPGALAANLVLIPVSTLVIFAGFLSLLGGLCGLAWLSVVLNHAGALVLAGIDAAVRFFVALPGACFPAEFSQAWIGGVALTLVLAAMLHGYAGGWETRRGGFWPPLGLTVLALVLGVTFGHPPVS